MKRGPHWLCVICGGRDCHYEVAVPLVPYAIRWGMDASIEVLRRSFRCSKCGHKGACTIAPSHNIYDDTQPMPTKRRIEVRGDG